MSMKITNGFQIVQDLIKLRWVPEILTSIEAGNNRYSELLESSGKDLVHIFHHLEELEERYFQKANRRIRGTNLFVL